jgi:hypothetical protein
VSNPHTYCALLNAEYRCVAGLNFCDESHTQRVESIVEASRADDGETPVIR